MGLRVVGVELNRELVLLLGRRPIPVTVIHEAKGCMSFGHLVVNLKGFAGGFLRLPPCLHRWQRAYQFRAESIVTVSQSHVSRSISRVFLDCALEKTDRLLQILRASVPIQIA